MTTLTIPVDRNGPRSSGNGGWTAGALAMHLPDSSAVTVMLRQPPPLGVAMPVVTTDGQAVLQHHVTGKTVATAQPAASDWQQPAIPAISPARATELAPTYAGSENHPFPTCYVCGLDRTDPIAMRLTPAATETLAPSGHPITACTWQVPDDVDIPTLWAALDCPGGWSVDLAGRPMVLGTMTATVNIQPAGGATAVIMGACLSQDNTKARTQTSLWVDGELCGEATAIWIAVDPEVFNQIQQA